jgi:uncharacterized membrane protein YdjX (TVP38/TMEM64 family)
MKTRFASLVLLFLLFGILYWMNPLFFYKLIEVLRSGDVDQIAAYLRSFGGWAVLVSILISTIMTFGLIIPFVIISAANGAVFGVGWGSVVSWSGEVIGAMIAFGIYRTLLRPTVTQRFRHSPHWQYVERLSGQHGFRTVLIARILPIIPSGVLTAVAAVSRITAWDFWWATVFGKIPSVYVKTLVGHDLLYFSENKSRLVWGLLFIVALYAGAWWWKKKRNSGVGNG